MVDRTVDDTASDPVEVEVDARRPAAPSEVERGEPVSAGRPWVQRLADRIPDLLAGYLAFVAMFCAVTALIPPLRPLLAWLRTAIEIVSVGAPPSLATAAFLGILAAAVRRRMRAAWWFVVVYVVLGRLLTWLTIVIATEADDPVAVSVEWGVEAWLRVAFGIVALALLLLARDRFTARTQRGNGWRALAIYLGFVLVGGLVGWGLLELFPGTLQTSADRFGWALTYVLGGLGSPAVAGIEGAGPRVITFLCGLFGALAVLAAAYVLFRPRRDLRSLGPDDEQRMRVLLDRYGDDDSLGYFATRRDKAAVFSPAGKSAITYRVVTGVSLASGDPIGDPEAWPRRDRGVARRGPALRLDPGRDGRERGGAPRLRARRAERDRARRRGDPRRRASSRWRAARCGRSGRPSTGSSAPGYTARVRRHAEHHRRRRCAAVVELADAWRDTDTERGFSMALGRLGDPADGRCVLVECFDDPRREHLRALLSFVPVGHATGCRWT